MELPHSCVNRPLRGEARGGRCVLKRYGDLIFHSIDGAAENNVGKGKALHGNVGGVVVVLISFFFSGSRGSRPGRSSSSGRSEASARRRIVNTHANARKFNNLFERIANVARVRSIIPHNDLIRQRDEELDGAGREGGAGGDLSAGRRAPNANIHTPHCEGKRMDSIFQHLRNERDSIGNGAIAAVAARRGPSASVIAVRGDRKAHTLRVTVAVVVPVIGTTKIFGGTQTADEVACVIVRNVREKRREHTITRRPLGAHQ